MTYIVIEDFRRGLDRRKMEAASVQGSLQACTNAHITRGGEIEKRKAFVPQYALPPGQTFGLEGAAGLLYTFGSDESPAVPDGIIYQRLEHGDGEDMSRLVSSEFFDGKIFAVAEYGNGDSLHFYDATEVDDFNSGSSADVEGQVLTSLLTFGSKLYGTAGSVLHFCNVDNPDNWIDGSAPDVGAGFKNMANQSSGSETLTALGKYQNLMAVFARRNIQLWSIDDDDELNVQRQVLSNIGTYAQRSVMAFGEADTFFLSDVGVRSLRARSNSDRAGVTDVGTPIDDEVEAWLTTLSETQKRDACATIDPRSGRYIVAVGGRCYVFSSFPSEKIFAWSRYDLGFTVDAWVSDDGRLWARSGDTVYLYGGPNGQAYDTSPVEIVIPFIDGRAVASFKHFSGIDVVCEGEWAIYAATDPNNPDAETLLARIDGTTVANPAISMVGFSTMIKLRLVNVGSGPAKLSKIIIHYTEAGSS